MLRRSVLGFSSYHRSVRRLPKQISSQVPSYLSSRNEFSTTAPKNASPKPGSIGNQPEPTGSSSKFLIGTVAVAGALIVAYQTGYFDQYLGKGKQNSHGSDNFNVHNKGDEDKQHLGEQIVSHNSKELKDSSPILELSEQKVESQIDIPNVEALRESRGESQSHVQEESGVLPEGTIPTQEKGSSEDSKSIISDSKSLDSGISSGGIHGMENLASQTSTQPNEEVASTHTQAKTGDLNEEVASMPQDTIVLKDNEMNTLPPLRVAIEEKPEEAPASLLDVYNLREKEDASIAILNSKGNGENRYFPKETEAFVGALEELNDGYISKDGKLILDFLQAIHAAEKRQAELDDRAFAEEKRALKEKYEKELRDSRARELMLTEEAAILDKELKREKAKAASAIKSIQEKMEEKLTMELEQKENEAESKLKKVQELAKAELAAAIASEKAAQIEKMAEADLNINALCMAFYARSEEARKSHSVHKLALGALALEDAFSKGLPIQKEVDALHAYLEGIDRDSILGLVLSSLPEETRCYGTDTLLQLHQKFDALKGTLRHFSLIPPGGGGILTHSLAHVASWLKVKEVDQSGAGIDSVINRVESYLADGKLAEAAETLEQGVRGSQAEEIVIEWVRRARNRAITEQALTFLQSYATCISLT